MQVAVHVTVATYHHLHAANTKVAVHVEVATYPCMHRLAGGEIVLGLVAIWDAHRWHRGCLWMGCMVSLGVLGGNSVWMGEKDCHIPHIYRTEQALEQLYLPTNLPTTCCSGHGGARALSGDASVAGGPFAGCPPASLAGEPTRPVADRS